ncbi:type III pantothenate kinase [Planctomycetaceae bacterium]|nr:type III pantothenate kinase [Planctomycetaceae bacterium]MDC0262214.1 type III pantothenate kinase [Planctomycetaceae bacterium]MDG2388692.1 type III pantothenate kinase [Planctomycetaceae bacterium]
MESPLIVFDVGNSRLKAGLFDRADDSVLPSYHTCHTQDVSQPLNTAVLLEWAQGFDQQVPAIATGSSPGGVETLILDWSLTSIAVPIALRDRNLLCIETNVSFPEKVGIDRLLNAIAANQLRQAEQAALVVDSGTATTVDLIDEEGVFQGGAILPSLRLSANALHHYTQLLPLIPLDELQSETKGPIGKETREAIRSGLYWGQIGAIRELTGRISREYPQAIRLLTGGGASLFADELYDFELTPNLSLRGFAMLAEKLLD